MVRFRTDFAAYVQENRLKAEIGRATGLGRKKVTSIITNTKDMTLDVIEQIKTIDLLKPLIFDQSADYILRSEIEFRLGADLALLLRRSVRFLEHLARFLDITWRYEKPLRASELITEKQYHLLIDTYLEELPELDAPLKSYQVRGGGISQYFAGRMAMEWQHHLENDIVSISTRLFTRSENELLCQQQQLTSDKYSAMIADQSQLELAI